MDKEIIEEVENTETLKKKKRVKRLLGVKQIIEKLLSPVTGVIDSVKTDYSANSRIKKTFIAMFKLRTFISVFLIIAVIAGGCFFYYRNSNSATAEMSLNYEEAANGLNPNATRFNAYNISSKEVVEDALVYCGIDPESVDVKSLCDAITISSTNNKAFSQDDYYISTTFKITLKKPISIKGISTDQLLTFLCSAYKDNFYSSYTENRSILDFDIDIFNDKEYLEIADLLDLKAQQIEKYLNTRAKQSKSFVEAGSNETFKSLVQKVEDLRNYDISKYRTFVIEAGCSYDKARYLTSLAYTNKLKDISYDKDITAYNVHNAGIRIYDEAMISVVMIPSIDEPNNTYYMSKTKTGMDYLASKADAFLETAQVTAKEITINEEIMKKMNAGSNSSSVINKSNQMIEAIRNSFSDLSRQIEVVDKAYIKYKTKDYLTFKIVKKSFLQRINLDVLAEFAAALIFLIYAAIWLKFRNHKGGNE